jgi:hypothetical protein
MLASHNAKLRGPESRMWAMNAAFVSDIYGISSIEVADALDLRDDSSRNANDGSRSGRRYGERGRLMLSSLGA